MTKSLVDRRTGVRPVRPAPSRGWASDLRDAFRDPRELCQHLGLPAHRLEGIDDAFPLLAPRPYVDRMVYGDVDDPLLRQVLPQVSESSESPGYVADPVRDLDATVGAGLLRKYQGRALLIASGACAVHCRYCFRRHYPYSTAPRGLEAWNDTLRAIEGDRSITEVILSGGDPLTLVDDQLSELMRRVNAIRHVERIRIHTRVPVVIPSRVTRQLTDAIAALDSSVVIVIHANHPNEIDPHLRESLLRLASTGAQLLNQSVLLAGVNDNVRALRALSLKLFDARVLPYYLHRLDRVAGAAHFATAPGVGEGLVRELRKTLPGYLVPRFVTDTCDPSGKAVLA